MLSFLKPTINFLKKAFLVIVVYFIVISLFVHFISKDKVLVSPSSPISPIEKNRTEIYEVINDKKLNSTKEGKMIIGLYKFTICGMIGEACTDNPKDGNKNSSNSFFGFVSKLIVTPFANPPASGISWAYESFQQAGFIPKTMAAEGIGFTSIKPFANIWKIFRDVSYMFLVIVLIAIGFMIMFRAKINPQTVISVENALPKIVITLILITFSFAIAGFLIDLMYVSIVLIISILSNNGNNFNAVNYQNEFIGADFLHIFTDVAGRSSLGSIIPIIGDSLLGIIDPTIVFGLRTLVGIASMIVLNNTLFHTVETSLAGGLNGIIVFGQSLGSLPGALLAAPLALLFLTIIFYLGSTLLFTLAWWVLIGGTVAFVAFRIIALLFSSYIKLILIIIISPLLLLFESVPGKNILAYWIKNIIGFLLPFPITVAISLIGYIIINNTTPAGYVDVRLPYLFGINSSAFKILVGMGLIFIIPEIVKLVKEVLGIKELPLNVGVGTFFAGATAIGGAALGSAGQFGSITLALGAFGPGGIFKDLGKKIPIINRMHPPDRVAPSAGGSVTEENK